MYAIRSYYEALHHVGMQDFARKSIHALSHGQKKRICVAGILAMEPQVIILDEPRNNFV